MSNWKSGSRVQRRKIVTASWNFQIYSIFPAKALLFVRASKTRSQISCSSSFSELKTMKCFESGLKNLRQAYVYECLEWSTTNQSSKSAAWYSKWYSWIWILQYHGWWEHRCEQLEQHVICIRRVDKKMTVCEDYIGLMPVAQTNADTIVVCFKDVLLCMNLRIQDARGQCYDGCLAKTGTKNAIAAQIKKLNEKCLLMHCHCHSPNLVWDTIKNIPLLNDTFDMGYEISNW